MTIERGGTALLIGQRTEDLVRQEAPSIGDFDANYPAVGVDVYDQFSAALIGRHGELLHGVSTLGSKAQVGHVRLVVEGDSDGDQLVRHAVMLPHGGRERHLSAVSRPLPGTVGQYASKADERGENGLCDHSPATHLMALINLAAEDGVKAQPHLRGVQEA